MGRTTKLEATLSIIRHIQTIPAPDSRLNGIMKTTGIVLSFLSTSISSNGGRSLPIRRRNVKLRRFHSFVRFRLNSTNTPSENEDKGEILENLFVKCKGRRRKIALT